MWDLRLSASFHQLPSRKGLLELDGLVCWRSNKVKIGPLVSSRLLSFPLVLLLSSLLLLSLSSPDFPSPLASSPPFSSPLLSPSHVTSPLFPLFPSPSPLLTSHSVSSVSSPPCPLCRSSSPPPPPAQYAPRQRLAGTQKAIPLTPRHSGSVMPSLSDHREPSSFSCALF